MASQVKTKYDKAEDKVKSGKQWRYNYEPNAKLSALLVKEKQDRGCSFEHLLNERLERDYKKHPHKKKK